MQMNWIEPLKSSGRHAVIAEGLPVSRPAVSQHLKVLKEAGLSGWDSTFWNLKDWYREA